MYGMTVEMTAEQFIKLRRTERLYRLGLAFHEEWPLFSVTKKIVDEARQVWVVLDDMALPSQADKPAFLRHLLGELRTLEYRLEQDGIIGWLQAIRKGNWRMRRWAEIVGATLYAEDLDRWFFKKVAGEPKLPKSIKDMVESSRGRIVHAHAAHA